MKIKINLSKFVFLKIKGEIEISGPFSKKIGNMIIDKVNAVRSDYKLSGKIEIE